MVKSGEKMGVEGIWLREENGGPESFFSGPTIFSDFGISSVGEKIWGKKGLWKITHLPLSPPTRYCSFFYSNFFFF